MKESYYKDGVALDLTDIEKLSEDQEKALQLVHKWYKNSKANHPFFVLGGASGSGKSSLIPYIIEKLKIKEEDVCNCALTGKAALVLRRKGLEANTIHSKIYQVHKQIDKQGKINFYYEKVMALHYKLIIADEASMIDQEIFDDLLSFKVPILFIGDHFQLPPVKSYFNIMQAPDFRMEKVLRQLEDSPILKLAMMAHRGEPIPYRDWDGVKKITMEELTTEELIGYRQIIVGTNKKRDMLNEACRSIKGLGEEPQADDKMIILVNNPMYQVFNGQIIYLVNDAVPHRDKYKIKFIDEYEHDEAVHAILATPREAQAVMGMADKKFPTRDSKNPNQINPKYDNKILHLDYGYAISCHRAQGSSWDNVIVFDDEFGKWESQETYNRWMYTAITRAETGLIIVKH